MGYRGWAYESYHKIMKIGDWAKTKKRGLSYFKSIWLYVWDIDHENGLSTTTCDRSLLNGLRRLILNFHWFGESVW